MKSHYVYRRLIEKELLTLDQSNQVGSPEIRHLTGAPEIAKLFLLAERNYLRRRLYLKKHEGGLWLGFSHNNRYGGHKQRYQINEHGFIVLLMNISWFKDVTLRKNIYSSIELKNTHNHF